MQDMSPRRRTVEPPVEVHSVLPRRTRSVAVRGALVDAAVRVLERDGLVGLTVRAVAAEAGVAPMGVYNHFEGKDGLILAVLERGFDGLREAITIRPGPPALDRIRASGIGYRTFALANPITYELMFGRSVAPEIHERLTPHSTPALAALVDLVAQAQREGAIREGDPMSLAIQIWSAVHGAVSLELSGSIPEPEQAETIYGGLCEAVLIGLAAQQ
jgi:AcrR family transcriptional regulator